MGQVTLSIPMDEDIKKRFDSICADVGMNATIMVSMFVHAVLQENGIPHKIANNTFPSYYPADAITLPENHISKDEKQKLLDELVGAATSIPGKSDRELITDYLWEKYERNN